MKRRLKIVMVYTLAAAILTLSGVCGLLLTREPAQDAPERQEITVRMGEVRVAAGEPVIISVSGELQPVSWESSDEAVVTVDSGGRLDAVEAGEAEVTARFANGRAMVYTVTAGEGTEAPAADVFSTAVTANEDVLKKNRKETDEDEPSLIRLDVNREQNVVTAYTYDGDGNFTVPVRAMVCSCGLDKGTITGEFNTFYHDDWDALFDDVFGRYVTGIDGNYLFHSVPYTALGENDTLETEEYNKLGSDASLGCVRLAVADAKWIYENCAVGTAVRIYDSDKPEPLGKPEAIRVADERIGWDPTDDDEDNPFNGKTPEISLPDGQVVRLGADFDPLADVTATDSCGSDATERLEVIGNVVTAHRGEYKLTYRLTDPLHRTAEVTRIVWVV